MIQLLLATANPHKAREIAAIVPPCGLEYLTLADFPALSMPEETGATLKENAVIKAVAAARGARVWTLADDTGLEVDFLDGAPGVLSARYAGKERDYAANNAKLLRELAAAAPEQRTARFKCVVALASPDGWTATEEGTLEGAIAKAPAGANGFGYDPLFLVAGGNKTLAELTELEKNRISHRHAAIQKIAPYLEKLANGKLPQRPGVNPA